jgi:6-phosphogluconolactonase
MSSSVSPNLDTRVECWVAQSAEQLADIACQFLVELLQPSKPAATVAAMLNIALSGGSTPKRLYERMTQADMDQTLWSQANWFLSDERNVPLDHAESNFGLANRHLFQAAAVDSARLHPVPIEVDAPQQAALLYETLITSVVPTGEQGRPAFDLVFLGLGDDAHTASLFPGTEGLHEKTRNVISNFVPKLNTQRITFTAPMINAAKTVMFLVTGSSKTSALQNIWHGDRDPQLYPAQLIEGGKRTIWLVDQAALGSLSAPVGATIREF